MSTTVNIEEKQGTVHQAEAHLIAVGSVGQEGAVAVGSMKDDLDCHARTVADLNLVLSCLLQEHPEIASWEWEGYDDGCLYLVAPGLGFRQVLIRSFYPDSDRPRETGA